MLEGAKLLATGTAAAAMAPTRCAQPPIVDRTESVTRRSLAAAVRNDACVASSGDPRAVVLTEKYGLTA